MKNAFTIDLEDYYHVSAFAEHVDKDEWHTRASRVEANTDKILDLLDAAQRRATFFVLGWVAQKEPKLIRRIAERGHEIACHSLEHRLVDSMSRAEFREDTRRAVRLLEDAAGTPVRGYRAPSFSITPQSFWAFEVLAEQGFTYDSSIFPVRHINYGIPDAPRAPYRIDTPAGALVEFPMPTLEIAGRRSPLGGGAYLRLLPYWYTRWGIRFLNERERKPVCVYVHPWELDPEQPRMRGVLTSRLRHYIGLRGTQRKMANLLRDFEFCTLGSLVAECLAQEPVAVVHLDGG
jgi:polysaccharide deacetylase family protein (PEP-CTERM system associated)